MKYLIDNFSPGELLHIVTVANCNGLLETDDKRYIIALRMSAAYTEGSYRIDSMKKNRFPKVFARFIHDLRPDMDCGGDECQVCRKFHNLREDFDGPQSSQEFRDWLAWMNRSTMEYAPQDSIPTEHSSYVMEPSDDDHASPQDIAISQARTRLALIRKEKQLEKAEALIEEEASAPVKKRVKVKLKSRGASMAAVEPVSEMSSDVGVARTLSDEPDLPGEAVPEVNDEAADVAAEISRELTQHSIAEAGEGSPEVQAEPGYVARPEFTDRPDFLERIAELSETDPDALTALELLEYARVCRNTLAAISFGADTDDNLAFALNQAGDAASEHTDRDEWNDISDFYASGQ